MLKPLPSKLVLTLLMVGFLFNVFAQKPTFSFQSNLSADSILIGDQVELTIQASLPKGFDVMFPYFADTIVTGIEVIGQPKIDTLIKRSGEAELTYRLRLTSFDEGYYRIPRFNLPFSDGEMLDTAQTSPIWFLVNTLPPDSLVTTIYDIKLPIAEPLTFAEVAPWIGGGLLLAGLIALLAIYLIKRKKGEPIFFPVKPADPPHVIALRDLEKIKEDKLWETQNHKFYHTVLTDIIRNYVEGRFEIPAMEQTTFETINSLQEGNFISSKMLYDLNELLSLSDLVKFAKLTPTISENEAGLNLGFRFVNNTKVLPQEENGNNHIPSDKSKEISTGFKEFSTDTIKPSEQ